MEGFQYEIFGKENCKNPVSYELCREGVGKLVAQEKSEIPDQLHYKIAELGPERIRNMVLEIFEKLLPKKCQARDIANSYGLDKITFSRFAGTKWANSDSINPLRVPVLWRNTAGMLASDDKFVEAAKNSGLWDRIRAVRR